MHVRRTLADSEGLLYRLLGPVYDRISGERILFETARAHAVDLLHLRPGASVLDIACGTGRNHELIQNRIGPTLAHGSGARRTRRLAPRYRV